MASKCKAVAVTGATCVDSAGHSGVHSTGSGDYFGKDGVVRPLRAPAAVASTCPACAERQAEVARLRAALEPLENAIVIIEPMVDKHPMELGDRLGPALDSLYAARETLQAAGPADGGEQQ